MRTAALRPLAVVLTMVAVLSACSGSKAESTTSPTDTLAAAKKNLDETSGVRIGLSTAKLPSDVNGLLAADGVATALTVAQGFKIKPGDQDKIYSLPHYVWSPLYALA